MGKETRLENFDNMNLWDSLISSAKQIREANLMSAFLLSLALVFMLIVPASLFHGRAPAVTPTITRTVLVMDSVQEEWTEADERAYLEEVYYEASDEFTKLFNNLVITTSKNGTHRIMRHVGETKFISSVRIAS